jgi:hypothetical protein
VTYFGHDALVRLSLVGSAPPVELVARTSGGAPPLAARVGLAFDGEMPVYLIDDRAVLRSLVPL